MLSSAAEDPHLQYQIPFWPISAVSCVDQGETVADDCGITIAFSNLCYYVPHPRNRKEELQLLHDVKGVFKPGLCALMGSSGVDLFSYCMIVLAYSCAQ